MKVAFVQKGAYEKVGVHYLAGALRDTGIEYDVFIEELEQDFYGELVKYAPSIVVYSLFIGEEAFAFECCARLKKLVPDLRTVVGGPFTLLFPEVCRREEVDFVLRGDGEFSLPRFIKLLEAGQSVRDIDGICYIDDLGDEQRNDNLKLVDVTCSPQPDRDLYYKYQILRNKPTKIFIASRGCPYKCTFCYNAQIADFFEQRYWRQRKVEDVIKEVRYVKEKYGVTWVHFQDGTFNANKKWLKDFLLAYIEAQLPPFMCNARTENMDEEIIRLLKKAGCDRVTFGIQSGSPRVRKEIAGRPVSNEQIIEACDLCRKHQMRVSIDVIFGWPGETLDEAMETIRLCRRVQAENYSSNVLLFYPGLSVTQYAYEKKFIPKIPSFEDVDRLNLNTSMLTGDKKNLLVNMDKLFFYMIKFPFLEPLILLLLRLPPNRFFFMLKNMHLLVRSLKYDARRDKLGVVKDYLVERWEAASKLYK